MKLLTRSLLVAAVALGPVAATALPATAAGSTYRIAWSSGGVSARSGPAPDFSRVGAVLPNGTSVTVACEQTGRPVSNGSSTTDLWERLSDGRWVPNAFVDTAVDGRTPGVPACAPSRSATQSWALANVDAPPGAGTDTDCAWYVSHALWAGGLPMSSGWTDDLGSTAAVNADALVAALVRQRLATSTRVSWSDPSAGGAEVGDLIGYDWGKGTPAGLDHVAVVTSIDSAGRPHVSQHSAPQRDRLWSFSAIDQRPIASDPSYSNPVAYAVRLR